MSEQKNQVVSMEPTPNSHDDKTWSDYRRKWYNYCDAWLACWDSQQGVVQAEMKVAGRVVDRDTWLNHWKKLDQPFRQIPEIDGWADYLYSWMYHWQKLGLQWRTQPEIDEGRQTFLKDRLKIPVDQGFTVKGKMVHLICNIPPFIERGNDKGVALFMRHMRDTATP